MPMFGSSMPTPLIDEDTSEFWKACSNHRLVIQQCRVCGRFRFAPAPVCYSCRSNAYSWIESDGVGEIYTWTVTHRPAHPATAEVVPYNTVVVKLLDCGGAMITSNLLDVDSSDIKAGMKVSLVWDDISADLAVPRFRPI
jgi:uncharacterized protein